MFCVKCGKDAKIDNFCETCFAERHELFDIKSFTMFYCDVCKVKENEIKEKIKSQLKSKNSLKSIDIKLKIVGNKVHATVTCQGNIRGAEKTETKKALIILRRQMCEMHVRLSGGYYEAVFQVRGNNKESVMKAAERLLPRKSIVGVNELKEGYDIKIMSKNTAIAAVKELRRKGCEVKDSYKLVGSKKGQKLYRNYYAIR
jgi:NMD protein affecting ribosome stability and mRNA decay